MPLGEKRDFFANKNINRIAFGFSKYLIIRVSYKTKNFPFAKETVILCLYFKNQFTWKQKKWYIF